MTTKSRQHPNKASGSSSSSQSVESLAILFLAFFSRLRRYQSIFTSAVITDSTSADKTIEASELRWRKSVRLFVSAKQPFL